MTNNIGGATRAPANNSVGPVEKLEWLHGVLRDPEVTPATLQVAVALVKYVNGKTGDAFPSWAALARDAGLKTERAVQIILGRLERLGHIVSTVANAGGGRGNRRQIRYRLQTTKRETGNVDSANDRTANPEARKQKTLNGDATVTHRRELIEVTHVASPAFQAAKPAALTFKSPKEQLFAIAPPYLTCHGFKDEAAVRRFLGGALKEASTIFGKQDADSVVLAAVKTAIAENSADPRSAIMELVRRPRTGGGITAMPRGIESALNVLHRYREAAE